jgi:hypothetical protein
MEEDIDLEQDYIKEFTHTRTETESNTSLEESKEFMSLTSIFTISLSSPTKSFRKSSLPTRLIEIVPKTECKPKNVLPNYKNEKCIEHRNKKSHLRFCGSSGCFGQSSCEIF